MDYHQVVCPQEAQAVRESSLVKEVLNQVSLIYRSNLAQFWILHASLQENGLFHLLWKRMAVTSSMSHITRWTWIMLLLRSFLQGLKTCEWLTTRSKQPLQKKNQKKNKRNLLSYKLPRPLRQLQLPLLNSNLQLISQPWKKKTFMKVLSSMVPMLKL